MNDTREGRGLCDECGGSGIDGSHDAALYYADRGELSACEACWGTGRDIFALIQSEGSHRAALARALDALCKARVHLSASNFGCCARVASEIADVLADLEAGDA